MIERIIDLPGDVLGFRASGEVTAADYQSVLVPAIEEKLSCCGGRSATCFVPIG